MATLISVRALQLCIRGTGFLGHSKIVYHRIIYQYIISHISTYVYLGYFAIPGCLLGILLFYVSHAKSIDCFHKIGLVAGGARECEFI